MNKFSIGDKVYVGDWFYGTIIYIEDGVAWCEFETGRGGGTLVFNLSELRKDYDGE